MSLRDRDRELRAVDLTAVHRHVDKNLLLTNDVDFNLGTAASAANVWTGTKNGCFLERELETTQYGGLRAVRADCCMHRDAITRSMTVL